MEWDVFVPVKGYMPVFSVLPTAEYVIIMWFSTLTHPSMLLRSAKYIDLRQIYTRPTNDDEEKSRVRQCDTNDSNNCVLGISTGTTSTYEIQFLLSIFGLVSKL
jgi:hypothetical protein